MQARVKRIASIRPPARQTEPDPPRERPWTGALFKLAKETATLPTVLIDEFVARAEARQWAGQERGEADAAALEDLAKKYRRTT